MKGTVDVSDVTDKGSYQGSSFLERQLEQRNQKNTKSKENDGRFIETDLSQLSNGPYPWRRYWARWVDLALYTCAFEVAFAIPQAIAELLLQTRLESDIIFKTFWNLGWILVVGLAAWISYWFVEALLISSLGTTLGKWLFGIRIVNSDHTKLSYKQALKRSFRVYWRGLALHLRFMDLYTQYRAYWDLSKNGITSWDRDGGILVIHKEIGSFRLIATLLLVVPPLVCYFLMILSFRRLEL